MYKSLTEVIKLSDAINLKNTICYLQQYFKTFFYITQHWCLWNTIFLTKCQALKLF